MSPLIVLLAASALEGGMWFSQDGTVQVQFDGMNFHQYIAETDTFVSCETVWPISDPQATATCDNGKVHKLYFDMQRGVVIFDDTALIKSEGEALD